MCLMLTFLMRFKIISNLNYLLQDSNPPPLPHTPRITKENNLIVYLSETFFHIYIFYHASQKDIFKYFICIFLEWANEIMYTTTNFVFIKALKVNLILSKTHKNENKSEVVSYVAGT